MSLIWIIFYLNYDMGGWKREWQMKLSIAKHKVTQVERSNHKYAFTVKGPTLVTATQSRDLGGTGYWCST